MDASKAQRLTEAVNLSSDVFIISQALASNQLRLSGVNFFNEKGELGNTGKNLEKFLNIFNRTVYPATNVYLPGNYKIPKKSPNHIPVYNTEIAQCYPGKSVAGDRRPDNREIECCLSQNFLMQEIDILQPKLLLLMGKVSYETFYQKVLNKSPTLTLSQYVSSITTLENFCINGRNIFILPIQHASGANPSFKSMLKNTTLTNAIKAVLN